MHKRRQNAMRRAAYSIFVRRESENVASHSAKVCKTGSEVYTGGGPKRKKLLVWKTRSHSECAIELP